MKIAKIIWSYDKKRLMIDSKATNFDCNAFEFIHLFIYSVTYLFGQQILLSTSYIFNTIQITEGTEMKMRQKSLPSKKKKKKSLPSWNPHRKREQLV